MDARADSAPAVFLTTGAEYSSGNYGGSDDIKETYVPVQLRYQTSRYNVALTVPYLSVEAPEGTITTGPGGTPIVGTGKTTTESGIGDVILGGTLYDVWMAGDNKSSMDLAGKVKFGTADENKGLGTGENDYAVYANFYHWFDNVTLLGSVGYRYRGDPPGVDLKNTASFSAGGAYRFTNATSAGVVYDYRQSSLSGTDAPSELTAYVSQRLDSNWRLKGYVFTGFSDSSPDWGVGVLMEWRMWRQGE